MQHLAAMTYKDLKRTSARLAVTLSLATPTVPSPRAWLTSVRSFDSLRLYKLYELCPMGHDETVISVLPIGLVLEYICALHGEAAVLIP
eukprot:scaffold552681_cov22-Prasinocladus_malaysianus.AAC.2